MCALKKVSIPATRDPFVNNYLIPAGIDKISGEERFLISTWNSNSGCLAVLVTPSGKSKVLRFDVKKKQFGFYGAAYGGNNTMWLSSFLDEVVKLDLETGVTEKWNTGLPRDLSFCGLVYDPQTKKVFSGTYCQKDFKCKAFSFDTVNKSISALYESIPAKCNYLRFSIKNNDGTYTLFNFTPDMELFIWNPAKETLEVIPENFKMNGSAYGYFIRRDDGAVYIPYNGWYDPLTRKYVEGPKADHETSWFALKDNTAYGVECSDSGNSTIYKWNFKSNLISKIMEIPDASPSCFTLTSDGKIICVNFYGYFYRINPDNMTIECSAKLDTDSVGSIDCLYRINKERLLCTPFITQRFYEINLDTGKGTDMGRATAGGGEVLKVSEVNGKIYMASYTCGQLVEYDYNSHANFPENPRIVVYPPNALRPVGMCTDGRSIYYTCSHKYGFLGSIMIKYSPSEGNSIFKDNPVPNQMLRSMIYDNNTNSIIAGSTYNADCNSCKPSDDNCYLVRLNADTLDVEKTYKTVEQPYEAIVYGMIDDNTCLCKFSGSKNGDKLAKLNVTDFTVNDIAVPKEILESNGIYYTGKPGYFIITDDSGISLWNIRKNIKVNDICNEKGFYRLFIQKNSIYLVYNSEIHIYEDCM